MNQDKRESSWPMLLLASAALSLALYLVWAVASSDVDLAAMTPLEWARMLGELLAGPALLLALAAAFRPRPPGRTRDPLLAAAADGEELEARTTGLVARLEAVSAKTSEDLARIDSVASLLEERATAATRKAADAMEALQGLAAGAAEFEERLRSALASAGELRGLLEMLAQGAEAARLAAEALQVQATEVKSQGETSAQALRAAIAGMAEEASAAVRLGQTAGSELAQTVAAQVAELSRATSEARTTLSAIGAEAARALGRHLESLIGKARELETRIAAQANATETLAAAAEKGFQLLDKRMEHSAATADTTLGQLRAQLEAIHGQIDAIAGPLRSARGAVLDMQAAVKGLDEQAEGLRSTLTGALATDAREANRLAVELGSSLAELTRGLDEAKEAAERLADPVTRSARELGDLIAAFEAQREAMTVAGEALVVELEQARQLIAEVEKTTESTSLAAATRLVDALTRVRDVSAQATGTMRTMLEGLIAEARESLGEAATAAVRQGFVEQIAGEAAKAEAKAREAAERSAASLARLAEAVQLVDARASDQLKELAAASDRDLASAAAILSERLAAESISLSSALGKPMSDADWAQWRKGERSLFGRRLVSLLEREEATALRKMLRADGELAAAASRLVAGMDALIGRLEASGQDAVAALLRGSDWGRLAAALSEALED